MTDYERTIEFLESLRIKELEDDNKEGYIIYDSLREKSIEIVPKRNQNLIKGDGWADITFNFDTDGNFKNIEITGD